VLLLELVIMPGYVYQPIRRLLDADAATRRGDRRAELVAGAFIPGDEIGQIMHSRNETVRELRRSEDDLAHALERLEATAADLVRKNEMLEAAKRKLEAQDRLVSLGLLSASVAHEMNTPLAVLHGSIEQMLEAEPSADTRLRLQRMIRVTQRLRRISEGLLDFARVRHHEMAPVPLRPLVEEAWHLVAIDEKAQQVCFENHVPERACVTGNAGRLVQVFVNLLRNSLHAVPRGGHIAAAAEPAVLNGSPALAISVEDNGPGIPEEVLPEIFDAFVSTRLDARGTGLGLTVAEGIIHQHGGAISAANRPGGGARLEVLLPAPEKEQA
jgi:signal transduction histidine kinase